MNIQDSYFRITINSSLNRAFKDWPEIFNNDSTLTAALLDRLLHHAETVVSEGKSYRMKDQINLRKSTVREHVSSLNNKTD